MTTKPENRKPTEAELAILDVIWERGSATVREVYQVLNEHRKTGYTTVLKLMQIMREKGILKRDESVRPQIYRPAHPRKKTQKMLLKDLLNRAFQGSAGSLVLQALSMERSTPEELREIRELLDKLEEEK